MLTCNDGGDGAEIGAAVGDLLGGGLRAVATRAVPTDQVFYGFKHFRGIILVIFFFFILPEKLSTILLLSSGDC